jgi:hypothetical protein
MLIQGFIQNLWLIPVTYFREKKAVKSPLAFDFSANLRLRKALEGEGRFQDTLHGTAVNPSCVIETVVEVEGSRSSEEIREAAVRVRNAWLGLLLWFPLILKMTFSARSGDLPVIAPESAFNKSEASAWTLFLPRLYMFKRYVRFDELEKFREWWIGLDALRKPEFLTIAMNKFATAVGMFGEFKGGYQFVEYVSCLEALLGEVDEAAHKLSLRTAVLLGGTDDDRQNTYDFMRVAYRIRSKFVHGHPVKRMEVRHVLLEEIEAVGRLHAYTRRCLFRVITLLDGISGLTDGKIKASWFRKDDAKKRLTDLLDYCLVRDDLRMELDVVLSGKADPCNLLGLFEKYAFSDFYSSMLDEKNRKARQGVNMNNF